MHNLTACPDCGGQLTAEAFAPVATGYARCRRCGHMFDRARVTVGAEACPATGRTARWCLDQTHAACGRKGGRA